MKIKNEHIYNTVELLKIIDQCKTITELEVVDDYINSRTHLYMDNLVNQILMHIHNSIKFLKHGNNI